LVLLQDAQDSRASNLPVASVVVFHFGATKNGGRICPLAAQRAAAKKSNRRYTVISVSSNSYAPVAQYFLVEPQKKATIENFLALNGFSAERIQSSLLN
jgi:hypothetical protein